MERATDDKGTKKGTAPEKNSTFNKFLAINQVGDMRLDARKYGILNINKSISPLAVISWNISDKRN